MKYSILTVIMFPLMLVSNILSGIRNGFDPLTIICIILDSAVTVLSVIVLIMADKRACKESKHMKNV